MMKTLVKKNTLIGKVRDVNQSQIERVCQLLDWSHETYTQHQFTEYQQFVRRACSGLPKAAMVLEYSPVFRGFYNNEWIVRNANDFLPFCNNVTTELYEVDIFGKLKIFEAVELGDPFLLDEYLHLHSAQQLFYDQSFSKKYAHIIDQILTHGF